MTNTRNLVVVGIDGSTASLVALRWALKEAVTMEADVEVVHCYLPQTLTDFGFSTPHELHTASAIMVENEVGGALAEMTQPPPVQGCSDPGDPARVLLEKAENAALLVLGAHGKTVLRDVILGRVARTCLRQASCPVVIVGPNSGAVRHEPQESVSTSTS